MREYYKTIALKTVNETSCCAPNYCSQKTIKIPLFKNVEFRLGEIENLPVSDGFIDVIMSNYITYDWRNDREK